MDKKFFIYLLGILLFFYLISSVPYCVPNNFKNDIIKIESDTSLPILNYSKLILLDVSGNSMFPTIKDKSKCLCEKRNDLKVGDIIGFVFNNDSTLHRIISIDSEKIFTKGDNNDFIDYPIKREDVLCKILEVPRSVPLIKGLG